MYVQLQQPKPENVYTGPFKDGLDLGDDASASKEANLPYLLAALAITGVAIAIFYSTLNIKVPQR